MAIFDKELQGHAMPIQNQFSISPVRGVVVGDEKQCIDFCAAILKMGYLVTAALYPTVAKHAATARIAVSANHIAEELTGLCDAIKKVQ